MNFIKKNDQFQKLFLSTVHPFSVGFDSFFDRLNSSRLSCYPSTTFPPYNISKEENKTYIELALAGYTKDDVSVVIEEGTLTVSGKKGVQDSENNLVTGIANRKFSRKFTLGEFIEVNTAEMKDGMLTIVLEEMLPPEKQPKYIEIK
jgi:molecular chaperone IbpA